MPRSRSKWGRAVQVMRWLVDEFNLPKDLRMELIDDIDDGETFGQVVSRRGRLVVQLSRRACKTMHDYVYTTIHEAAHVKTYRRRMKHDHDDPFWLIHGQMNHAYDEWGKDKSADYPAD